MSAHDQKMEAQVLARVNLVAKILVEIEALTTTHVSQHEALQAGTVALLALGRTWLERWPERSRDRLIKLSMNFVPIFDSADESEDDEDGGETLQ